MSLLSKIFGDANERYLKSARFLVDEINQREKEFEKFSNEQIKNKTLELKKRIADGGKPESVLTEAFALVREAAKRTIQQRSYDVQLIGGMVLHQGKIAEMKTGEGKTLTATLTVYLNALEDKGVHVVTVNHDSSFIYDPLHSEETEETNGISNSNDRIKKLDKERDALGGFKVIHEF